MMVLQYASETMMTTQRYPPRRLLSMDNAHKVLNTKNERRQNIIGEPGTNLTMNGANDHAEHLAN